MTNYLKGFGISFLIHGLALAAVLCFAPAGSTEEKDLLVVDFSTVALGALQEGGSPPGAGARSENAPGTVASGPATEPAVAAKPAFEPAAPTAPAPETALEPAAPLAPMPDPAAKSAEPPKARPKASARPPLKEKPVNTKAAARAGSQTAQNLAGSAPQGRNAGNASPEGDEAGTGNGNGKGTLPGGGPGSRQGLAQGYIRTNFNYILVCIRRNLHYPDQARRQRLTGIAEFTFIIRQDGVIEALRLQKSSGHSILDEAAEKAIQRAAPFPKPPAPAKLSVPIDFRMG